MAAKNAVVLSALVIAKTAANGSDLYLYQGQSWPDGMADGEYDRLHDLQMVGVPGEFDEPAAATRRRRTVEAE